jgi:hypothetical protein
MSSSCKCGCGQTHGASCETEFQYAVKVVCGTPPVSSPPQAPQVAAGYYFTAINVHNPSKCRTISFRGKVAQALPFGAVPATPTDFVKLSLGPDQALEIDNAHIFFILDPLKPPTFVKGYVVLETPEELDVVAVYTVAPAANERCISFETERVPARCVPVCEDLVLPLSTGIADWQAVATPGGPPVTIGPVRTIPTYSAWSPTPFGSMWAVAGDPSGSHPTDYGTTNAPGGDYTYELSFDLCSGYSEPKLQFQCLVDDSAVLTLNNNPLNPPSISFPGFQKPTSVSASASAFQVGQNILKVVVTNNPTQQAGNPTGFAIAGLLQVNGGRCPCAKLPLLPNKD